MKDLQKAINSLKQSEEWKNFIDCVIDCADNGISIDKPEVQRDIDDLALTTAWVYDVTNHKMPNERGSMTKKIRKALGYTN